MKRLLVLAVLGALLGGATGCRFFDCLFRGPSCQQTTAPPVTYAAPCPTYSNCDPCAGAGAPATLMPGPGQ